MSSVLLSNILMAALTVIIGIAVGLVKVYFAPLVKTKLSDSQLKDLRYWTEAAVRFFEDNLKGNGRGEEKKVAVYNFLIEKGVEATQIEINMIIDAVVNRLNNSDWT